MLDSKLAKMKCVAIKRLFECVLMQSFAAKQVLA